VSETVSTERRSRDSGRPNAYRVDIRDCGPGVPDEHLSSIFEPYTSYAGSRDRAGSGLGLAICRMVVSAHRGEIFAASSEEGATFSFVLPFAENGARLAPRMERGDTSEAWPAAVGGSAEETA
jgi:signal transduction histidine kinase